MMVRQRDTHKTSCLRKLKEKEETIMRHDRIVNMFSHSAPVLLHDVGFSPQGVDTIHSHSQAEV